MWCDWCRVGLVILLGVGVCFAVLLCADVAAIIVGGWGTETRFFGVVVTGPGLLLCAGASKSARLAWIDERAVSVTGGAGSLVFAKGACNKVG